MVTTSTKSAASFGAALAAMAAPSVGLGAIAPIGGLPSTFALSFRENIDLGGASFSVAFTSAGMTNSQGDDEMPSINYSATRSSQFSIFYYNFHSFNRVVGTPLIGGGSTVSNGATIGGFSNANFSRGTFNGIGSVSQTAAQQFSSQPLISPFVERIGFLTTDNRAGWLRVEFLTDNDNPRVTIEGAIAMPGEAIAFGASEAAVPLPASLPLAGLGVLALGAAGLRRKRKARAAA